MSQEKYIKDSSIRNTIGYLLIAGAVCFLGLAVQRGLEFSRPSTITVRGLAEEFVTADEAEITMSASLADANLEMTMKKIQEYGQIIKDFMTAQKITPEELGESDIRVSDRYLNGYVNKEDKEVGRFEGKIKTGAFSKDVEKIQQIYRKSVELNRQFPIQTSVQYRYTKFDENRSPMLGKALLSAKAAVKELAQRAQIKIGRVLNIHQGVFEVEGVGQKEGGQEWGGQEAYKKKKIRVVISVTFEVLPK